MLDQRFGPAKTLLTAAKKTALGQVTLFPTYVAAFFTYMTLLETGGNVAAVGDKLRGAFVQTYIAGRGQGPPAGRPGGLAGSVFWPAANMLNFMFCPPAGRLLYVNCAGLAWNAILSAYNSGAVAAPGRERAAAASPA
ncbi:hypothetical protein PLESTF_001216500 [Pleodorina starrii]|nr:hypothetical protein PLESTM_000308300 [Pleodorina starrii]GLC72188.1 hypothetical protein PLESTF_001216500 [Pleodorina starrii]